MDLVQTGRRERLEGGKLAELYLAHATAAKRVAYLLTGDMAAAEDIVQDAFVRLAGRFLDVRDPKGFRSYLRKTVVSLAAARSKRRRLERAYLARQAAIPPAAVEPIDASTLAVRESLGKLTPRQRSAIVLRYYEDLSEEQIADIIGCRPGTVKSLLSRALESLRMEVDE